MSLYRVGRIYYIDLDTARGRLRRSTGTADKAEAQAFHERVRGQLWRQEQLGEAPPITWAQAVQKWLSIKPRGEPDRYRIRALTFPLDAPLPLSAQSVEAELVRQGLAGASFNRTLALIVAIHGAAGVEALKVQRRPVEPGRTRWLSREEWTRLRKALAAESPLLEQCARFTLSTGLRENNVLGLTWDRVDLRRRVAFVEAPDVKQRMNLGVPLNDDALAVLEERRGVDAVLVFGNPDYQLYKASNRAWYEALRKAKLVGFRWHDLRHTWASWAVMSGVRIEELQRLGGWKTLAMVQRYAHLAPEHLADVAAKVRPISRYNASRRARRVTDTP